MKKDLVSIGFSGIFLLFILLFGELSASKYANGVFMKSKPIIYNLELQNINGPWFINSEGLSVISQGEILNSGADVSYPVERIMGYQLRIDTLDVLAIVNDAYLLFSYGSESMVSENIPQVTMVTSFDEFYEKNPITLLSNPPLLIYYWKLILPVLLILWVTYSFLTLRKFWQKE